VRVVQGRSVNWDDRSTTQPVAIVNQAFIQRHYPGRDAIGLQIPGAGNGRSYTVVGVVDDVRLEGPMYPPQPAFYVSLLQRTQATFFNRVNVVVRVLDNPLALTGALREVVRTTDARLALADVTTLDRQLSEAVARPRLYASALAACAVLSLTVVVIGLFAALAYTAGQRRREVAVRLAIGSSRAQVVRLLLRDAAITVSVGLVLGVVGGGVAGRAMASLLHGVLPGDPYTLAMAPGLLFVAAGVAALVPVTEVLRTDVARALRSE
jgi:putative ABC transport system permease protein